MVNCQDVARLRTPLPTVCNQTVIGFVPEVNGFPSHSPTPDQLPLAYSGGNLFFYTGSEWKVVGLSSLEEVNLSNVTNLDNVLRIPVTYNTGTQEVEGYITLKELKSLL